MKPRAARGVIALALASNAAAIRASPAGATAPAVGDAAVRLQIVDQRYGVVAGEMFTATVELTGSVDDAGAGEPGPVGDLIAASTAPQAAGAAVELVITARAPIDTTDQLTGIDEQGPGAAVDAVTIAAADVFALPAEEAGTATAGEIEVPVALGGVDGLSLERPGIHPVTVDLTVDAEVVASATTFVELIDPERDVAAQPLAVSILAGIADPGPWPSATELSSASIEFARLIELSESVDGPLSIAVPPGLVTALSAPVAGANPPPTATTGAATSSPPGTETPGTETVPVTTALAGAPGTTDPAFTGVQSPDSFASAFRADELFAVPEVALDPSSLVALGQSDLFTRQLRLGEDALSTASPRAVVSRAVWLAREPVSAPAMVTLRNLGIRMLVVTDETAAALGVPIAPSREGGFAVSLGANGSLPGMTFDPLGEQLLTPIAGQDSAPANEIAVRLLVQLQLQRAATGTPAILLAAPRITIPDPEITARFVSLATAMPDISIVPISRLPGIVDGSLAQTPTTPVSLPASAGADLTTRLDRVAEARIDATHAASMLVESDRSAEWDAELDRVMSTAVGDATAFEHLAETQVEIDDVLGAIVPPSSDSFRITGASSTLRLRIENTYPEPLNVVVHVRSPKLRFPQPDPLVAVPPGESRLVRIEVDARSNGTFTIEVDVLTPDGAPLAQPVIVTARVTRITGLSQAVTGAAVLVLVSWWYSHLRRSRRRRLEAPDEPGAVAMVAISPDAAASLSPPTDGHLDHERRSGAQEHPR